MDIELPPVSGFAASSPAVAWVAVSETDRPPAVPPEAHGSHAPPKAPAGPEKSGWRPAGEPPVDSPPPYPDDGTGGEPDRGSATSTPRWVSKVGIVIAIALVVLIVVLHLTGVIGPGAH